MEARVPHIDRLVIVRLSALGDVTLLLPVIETLKRVMPRTQITWITGTLAYELLQGVEGVEFIVFDKSRGLAAYADLRRQLKGRRFDALLALQASWRANFIYSLIAAPIKIGFDRTRARDGQWLFTNRRIPFAREHLLDSFFAFIGCLGIRDKTIEWHLPITDADRQWAKAQLPQGNQPLLAINAGASKEERDWPVDRFVGVIRAAQSCWDVQVVLTGGANPRELAVGRGITAAIPAGVTNLIGKTTPKQLAAVLAQATCLLAPDTGPVHIAVAMGTPVVGLYAVAPPELSGPYLYPKLVVNRYPEAVRKILGQDPATVEWTTRVHRGHPMHLIEVGDVLPKLAQVFDKPA